MTNPFFDVQDLSTGYHGHTVLHHVSFQLQEHTLTGLLGNNGCGKTTMLKALCCLLPHTGQSAYQGMPLESMTLRQRSRIVSYIPQRSSITISMSALDVVLMGFNATLGLLKQHSPAQHDEALQALDQVGIAHLAHTDYLKLSEGQKQLCILVRTLIEKAPLLLLDEPDSALDFTNRFAILHTLEQVVQNRPAAGLLCLHDPLLALEYCNQLVLLKDGKCVCILHPATDSVSHMEAALQQIYGPLSLTACTDSSGKRHLVMLPHNNC